MARGGCTRGVGLRWEVLGERSWGGLLVGGLRWEFGGRSLVGGRRGGLGGRS